VGGKDCTAQNPGSIHYRNRDDHAGCTALAGAGTAWDTNNSFGVKNMRAGGKIVFGGNEVYEIASVTDDTNAVLTTAFIGEDLSANSYTYFEDEYALSDDFLRPLDLQSFSDAMEIELIGRNDFRRSFPRNNVTGRPIVGTLVAKGPGSDTSMRRRIRFYRPPDIVYLIPYAFVTNKLAVSSGGTEATSLSADTDEPIVPLQYRHAIVTHALWHWYRDKKDDARSQAVAGEWASLMERIVGDNEIGAPRPQLAPRLGPYKSRAKRPWGGRGSSRHTTGTRFDEMRGR
jgi:hypothetical protein